MSQTRKILAHMMAGNAITPLGALGNYGVARLAARIHDIKRMGIPVHSELIRGASGKVWAEYRL